MYIVRKQHWKGQPQRIYPVCQRGSTNCPYIFCWWGDWLCWFSGQRVSIFYFSSSLEFFGGRKMCDAENDRARRIFSIESCMKVWAGQLILVFTHVRLVKQANVVFTCGSHAGCCWAVLIRFFCYVGISAADYHPMTPKKAAKPFTLNVQLNTQLSVYTYFRLKSSLRGMLICPTLI